MLIGGLTFASLLMTQQSSVFCGIMLWTTATLSNCRASIWVVDPNVQQVNEIRSMRDTDVNRVRTVDSVAWAVPLYWTILQAKLIDGTFQNVQLVGLESTTFVGRPEKMIQGKLEDLLLPKTVVVDTLAIQKLSVGRSKPLEMGDVFEINDKEARIVGICETHRSFIGTPYIFTTYDQAIQYSPKTRKMLSFVLAEPKPGYTDEKVAEQIANETQLKAYTEHEFQWATMKWYFINTGIPISFGTTIIMGFIVGIAICGQTFYTFVLDHLKHLGALKAMGASNFLLARMVLVQAFTVGFIGYGCGVGLASWFGYIVIAKTQPPFFMPYQLPLVTFGVIILICSFSALIGIIKVWRLEPAIVFRG